ncbi:Probable arabinosyltransferase A [Mycobacteroides abscessus subsp. abscessus]|nr:Probable arabinosyltransferase A [Mycobacteroides abscessus subsp. abscessus]
MFGTVLTWILVERAIATRRLSPAALAIVVALLAATVAPQGLIALGPLLAGGRAIARVVAVRRLRSPGTRNSCATTS